MAEWPSPESGPHSPVVRRGKSSCLLRLSSNISDKDFDDPNDCSPGKLSGDAKVLFSRCIGEGLDVCKFDYVQDVGHGSYGQVELWKYIPTQKTYVSKSVDVTKLSGHEQALVLQELRLLRSLEHPHLAVCWQAWGMSSVLVLLLTYYPGGSLEDCIKRGPYQEEDDAGRWLCQLLSALRFLHAYNVVHRDVCPANVFMSQDRCDVVLGDLGACRVLASQVSVAKTPMGHMKYLSPEMFEGEDFTCKTDIWSLGVAFRLLICGESASVAADMGGVQIPSQTAKDAPLVAGTLREVVSVMLEREAQLRPDAAELCRLPVLDAFWPLDLCRTAPDVDKELARLLWNSALKLGAVMSMRPEPDVGLDAN